MVRDGGNRRQVLTPGARHRVGGRDLLGSDGQRLAVTAGNTSSSRARSTSSTWRKGTVEKLTTHANGAFDPAWSPDGEAIAYIGADHGKGELWVQSLDGKTQAHVDGLPYVRSPTWSPDGKTLAVLAAQNGAFRSSPLTVKPTVDGFELGEPRQLTRDGPIDASSGLTWAQ